VARNETDRIRTAGVLVLVAVLTLVTAGCGGGGGGGRLSKSEYEQKMREIGKELTQASSGLDLSNSSDLDKLADSIAQFGNEIEDAANGVDDLKPPVDAEQANDKIADVLHAFAAQFDKLEDAARKGDLAALQRSQQEVIQKAGEAQRAADELKLRGYDIGEFGSG
jgi:hypothetical protein